MTYSVETSQRVYDDEQGVCIEFVESPDFPELIRMHTPNNESECFYGEIDFPMSIEHAKMVVKALSKQIESMENN